MGTALANADIKIVGTPGAGGTSNDGGLGALSSLLGLLSPQGGQKLNGLLETLDGTEMGHKLIDKFLSQKEETSSPAAPTAPTSHKKTNK